MDFLLKKVLNAHFENLTFSEATLSLGDGYLIRHNPTIRNIRSVFRSFGYGFTTGDSFHYTNYPIISLPMILGKKLVPVKDTVTARANLEKEYPGIFTFNEIWSLRGNRIFHESCHCIADYLSRTAETPMYSAKTTLREVVVRTLIGESFAIAGELLTTIYAQSNIHKLILMENTYWVAIERQKELEKSIHIIGHSNTTKLLFFSFLYSSFLLNSVNQKEFDRAIAMCNLPEKLDAKSKRFLFEMFNRDMNHQPEFRLQAVAFYLKQINVKIRTDQIVKLLNFDIMSYIEKDDKLVSLIDALISFHQEGTNSPYFSPAANRILKTDV